MTNKQKAINYLIERGFQLSPVQPSGKYETYTKHITSGWGETRVVWYHVGKMGAVLRGNKPGICNAISVTHSFNNLYKETP